jgi:hypothetical protein
MPQGYCERCGFSRRWLHKHHLKFQCDGGTDADGTMLICANCHEDVHEGPMGGKSAMHKRQSPTARAKRAASLRSAWERGAFEAREVPEVDRVARSVATRAGIARRTPEQNAERARKIGETKRARAAERNQERNARIRELHVAGISDHGIAVEVGCSDSTVAYTLKLQAEGLIP